MKNLQVRTNKSSIEISKIQLSAGTQIRKGIDRPTIEAYAQAMRDGDKFPPIAVFYDGKIYICADGFHRIEACRESGITKICCEIHKGGRLEALRFALGANAMHGLRLTNEDKRNAVEIAVKEFSQLTNRVIAEMCKVSHTMVNRFRRDQVETVSTSNSENANKSEESEVPPRPKRTGQDGKNYPSTSRPKQNKTEDELEDVMGLRVPPECAEQWIQATEISRRLLSFVSELKTAVIEAQKHNNPLFREVDHVDAISKLESVYTTLKVIRPYSVCFKCSGVSCDGTSKSCSECHGRGFISEFYYKTHIAEERKQLRAKALAKKK